MAYDTVVIGSGSSGLTTAIVLARLGRSVVVVERAAHTAPLLRRKRVRGFLCDLGFHYFGGLFEAGGFGALLRYLRIADRVEARPMDSEGFDEMVLPDGRSVMMPVGFERVSARLLEAFPKDRAGVNAYIERVQTLYRATPFATMGLSPADFTPTTKWEETLAHLMGRVRASEGLRQALGTYGLILFGRDATQASMHMHTMAVGSYLQGAHYFARGGDGLADALEEEARACGVEILCGRRVTGIVSKGRKVEAVEVAESGGNGRERLECETCVFTGHPKRLMSLLQVEQLRPAFLRRMGDLPETFAPFIIHMSVPSRLIPMGSRNRYILGRPGLDETPAIGLMGSGGSEAVSPGGSSGETMRSLSVVRMAWENENTGADCPGLDLGRCLSGGGREAPAPGTRYEDFRADMTASTMSRIYEVWPELRGKCRVLDAMGPCEFERVSDGWRGSMYGARQSLDNRILGPMGPLSGLYLAGQSIVTPGVAGSMISALVAVGAMVGWDEWWPKVEACR